MRRQIRRLRLRDGDIIVVKDSATMDVLVSMPFDGNIPKCPIIYAPEGIHRINKEYLRKLLQETP